MNNGGVIYSSITGSNNLLVDSSTISTSTSTSGSGGVAYLSGVSNTVAVQTSSTISASKANVNGGIFYT